MRKNATVVFLIILLFGISTGITTCQAITGNNQYITVQNNLNGNGADCLTVEAENTTIDCNGYFISNALNAILVKNSKNITIRNCQITSSTTGISINNVKNLNATGNGQIVHQNISASIEYVNISDVVSGIIIYADNGNKIRFANISATDVGIQLMSSSSNLIENSIIQNADVGILIKSPVRESYAGYSGSGRNVIRNNFIINNNFGIRMLGSKENHVYNNYFNNSIRNAETNSLMYGFINYWNSSYDCFSSNILNGRCSGGNFWSDYAGYDDGSGVYPYNNSMDGIGDTDIPYMIPGEPLMEYNDRLPLTKRVPDTWVTECKEITQSDTLYHIKQNIYGVISDTNHKCLHVRANNVVINCYGNRIEDNTSYTDSVGVYISDYSNLTLINCTIMNYSIGLYENRSAYGALYGNNFSNDQYDIFFSVGNDLGGPSPPHITFFLKNITTDNYVHEKKVYYYVGATTGDGYPFPPPLDAGMVGIINHRNFMLSGASPSWTYPSMTIVNASNGTISGVNLYNYSLGVFIMNSSNISIKDSVFADLINAPAGSSTAGLVAYNSTNLTVEQNKITSCPIAVGGCFRVLYSENITVSKNLFFNFSGTAVGVYSVKNPTFSHNNATNISSGFYLRFIKDGKIYNNTMYLTASAFPNSGIYIFVGNGTEVYSNTIIKISELYLRSAGMLIETDLISGYNTLKIYNNTINKLPNSDAWEFGMFIHGHMNSSIYNNFICNIHGTPGIRSGINLYGEIKNTSIYNNTICNISRGINSGGPGINEDNKIYNNKIVNGFGVAITRAIYLGFSDSRNLIYNNLINATTGDIMGIVWDESIGGENMWNSSYDCSSPNIIGGPCKGGNYYPPMFYNDWDYDGDGIGETPALIPGLASSWDYLPLAIPRKNIVEVNNKSVVLPKRIVINK